MAKAQNKNMDKDLDVLWLRKHWKVDEVRVLLYAIQDLRNCWEIHAERGPEPTSLDLFHTLPQVRREKPKAKAEAKAEARPPATPIELPAQMEFLDV